MALNLKGGRGQRAPYKSTHHRIPEPLKPTVERLAAAYKAALVDYEDPEDEALINSALQEIASQVDAEQAEKISKILAEYKEMQWQINFLRKEVETLQNNCHVDDCLKLVLEFIESQKAIFGNKPSQRDKEFSIKTRKWDAFRDFISFLQHPREVRGFREGEICGLTMPLGGTLEGVKIKSFQRDRKYCIAILPPANTEACIEIGKLYKL